MESALASNALEIAIIGGLIAVIVAFITIGAIFVFRLFNRVDQLADKLGETNERIGQTRNELSEKIDQTRNELSEKIGQTRNELSEKIGQTHRDLVEKIDQLRDDMMQQTAQMKTEIINALVNHSHPDPGGPPVFTAPPPTVPPDPATREPQATPADD
jgi:predicted PurR-regulated permease PerM